MHYLIQWVVSIFELLLLCSIWIDVRKNWVGVKRWAGIAVVTIGLFTFTAVLFLAPIGYYLTLTK